MLPLDNTASHNAALTAQRDRQFVSVLGEATLREERAADRLQDMVNEDNWLLQLIHDLLTSIEDEARTINTLKKSVHLKNPGAAFAASITERLGLMDIAADNMHSNGVADMAREYITAWRDEKGDGLDLDWMQKVSANTFHLLILRHADGVFDGMYGN